MWLVSVRTTNYRINIMAIPSIERYKLGSRSASDVAGMVGMDEAEGMSARDAMFRRAAAEIYSKNSDHYDRNGITIDEIARNLQSKSYPTSTRYGARSGAAPVQNIQTSPEYIEGELGEQPATRQYVEDLRQRSKADPMARKPLAPMPSIEGGQYGGRIPKGRSIRGADAAPLGISAADEAARATKAEEARVWREETEPGLRAEAAAEYAKGNRGGIARQKLWARERRTLDPASRRRITNERSKQGLGILQDYADDVAVNYGYRSGPDLIRNATRETWEQIARLPSHEQAIENQRRIRDQIPALEEAAQQEWRDTGEDGPARQQLRRARHDLQQLGRRRIEAQRREYLLDYAYSGERVRDEPIT
jgi:hypothetical protein